MLVTSAWCVGMEVTPTMCWSGSGTIPSVPLAVAVIVSRRWTNSLDDLAPIYTQIYKFTHTQYNFSYAHTGVFSCARYIGYTEANLVF